MRVEQFFSEFRSFATALETDCAALRKAVVEPQQAYPHGSEAAVDILRIMHDETADVMDTLDTLESVPTHRVSMAALAAAARALLDRTDTQVERVENELVQYGFSKLPAAQASESADADSASVADSASDISASSSQALDETHELNSTFTREEEEAAAALNAGHANDDDMPAGEAFDNDDPIAAAMRAAETEAAAVAHAAAAARTPARTPAAARTPARTPARALAAAVVESPKTPSLDDVGLSAAALSILQQTQPKRAGQGLRNVEAAESSHDSSLDMSNFQISSVPLKTPDAVKAKTMAAVVTAPTGLSTMATPAAAPLSSLPKHITAPTANVSSPDSLASPAFAVPVSSALSGGASTGLAAAISEAEFDTLPSFVKTQIEREYANEVLAALHQCIEDTQLSPKDVALTATQLQDDLGLGAKTKVFILLMLKLKRLALKGTDADGEHMYALA